MDIGKFATDEKLSTEGVWKDLGEGGKVKVAAANNPAFREAFRKKTEPYEDVIRRGLLDEETSREIMLEVLADTVLIDWKGITEGGKELACTRENKIRLLRDFPAFRDLISAFSDKMENFKKKSEADTLGNSLKGSSGTSSTEKT